MGANLSCVGKQQPADGSRKPKKREKKGDTEGDVLSAVKIEELEATQNGATKKPNVIYLSPAPEDFKLPQVCNATKKNKEGQYTPQVSSESRKSCGNLANLGSRVHGEQPVDQQARQLATGEEKPHCWKDLYWHLIGSRNFTNDKEKVRALFSWLCSISPEDVTLATGDDTIGAKHKVKFGRQDASQDSPDIVLPKLASAQTNYVQAFESLCRYSGIPCITVRGIAKSMDYKVGQPLLQTDEPLFNTETGILSPKIASLQHSWNAAFVDGAWCLFDCTWAAQRLAMRSKDIAAKPPLSMTLQYEADMFYYNVDPLELIYTHYPFEDTWQLIEPPISIVTFATWPLVKPAFFQYGLSLLSHREGYIPAETNLVIKLKMIPEDVGRLMFTYQLNLEGYGNVDESAKQTRFGVHEVSPEEAAVIFQFRLPRKGDYSLIIYARHIGEQLFSDVCEYRISSKGRDDGEGIAVFPFPPTAQASYGPTEKAAEYGLETLPRHLQPTLKSPKGSVELRFIASEPDGKIPRLTARLKSRNVNKDDLEDCILLREIEASVPTTGVSVLTATGPCIPMSVLNAYLPAPGEYALEIYAAPSTSEEPTPYHLVWQFLIEADASKILSAKLRSRLATLSLGAQDETWHQMCFRTLSHPDPVIRVRTAGRSGSELLLKANSKLQVLQRYLGIARVPQQEITGNEDVPSIEKEATQDVADEKEPVDPEAADLCILIGLPEQQKICLISQLVDISGDEEQDVTGYLLQKTHDMADHDEGLPGDRTSKETTHSVGADLPSQLTTILVRIPRAGAFYKLYLYAAAVNEEDIAASIPLVYTYLIEAPFRLTAAETPYIGSTFGEFPEKIEKRKAAEAEAAANATPTQQTHE